MENDEETGPTEEKKEKEKECIQQNALTVARNVKYHSSQTRRSPFIAENAMQKEDLKDPDLDLVLEAAAQEVAAQDKEGLTKDSL